VEFRRFFSACVQRFAAMRRAGFFTFIVLLKTAFPVSAICQPKTDSRLAHSRCACCTRYIFSVNWPMQGKKHYQEKMFTSFQLSERVPEENFYRRLKEALDLDFLYPLTQKFYGQSGQKSIDPVVFFKLCLAGYLENIISDRKLVAHCAMRLDILYFLGHDIDEPLPWHSTLSRTRQLFPEDIFEEVFTKILKMCIEAGMVSGHTQAMDSAPVKANAS